MEKEFFDKIFDQVLEEASTIYVENENNKKQEIDNSDFSDIHKQKMNKLFKEIRMKEYRKKAVRLTKKIAVVVLCTLLITAGLITSVRAWREQVVKFIMKNNDDNYMSIKFGDTEDEESGEINATSGDKEGSEFIIDDIKFMYIPEGFEFDEKLVYDKSIYYCFVDGNNFIQLKKIQFYESYSKDGDVENASNEKIEFKDKIVFKVVKETGRIRYIWYDEENTFSVSSNIIEKETLKFIENIKILKKF